MNFQIKIAGRCIKIQSLNNPIMYMCKNYLCEGLEPDFTIVSTENKIKAEYMKSDDTNIYSDKYMETLSVYREIAEKMLDYNTFLMHGAVVAVDNNAFMFTAPSGTGKTTRAKLWLDQVEGSYIVNGDKPMIKIGDKNVLACGTPWSGKEQMNTPIDVPLRAIYILERSDKTVLKQLTLAEAFMLLYGQAYKPVDSLLKIKTLNLIKQLNGKVKFFSFKSSLDDSDMNRLYHITMKGAEFSEDD